MNHTLSPKIENVTICQLLLQNLSSSYIFWYEALRLSYNCVLTDI